MSFRGIYLCKPTGKSISHIYAAIDVLHVERNEPRWKARVDELTSELVCDVRKRAVKHIDAVLSAIGSKEQWRRP